ncbi:limonene-1,2-epoxide hydrolase family protein [Williamsia sterculiae]|uniref:Limonene-1,2-epoxide hydrolase n=1 Tax=Williamsia sterculiae TaxID=1344003 RepID=A0A1N7DNT5_9NOCA|nr:limonene-1,2-epoxide hydrolase family protein [Williamsia sterculiae]SIR77499.1 limonene-1,2-epoxide hydrolase [Williamsia sterculiae]
MTDPAVRVVEEFFAQMESGDSAAAADLLADDVVFTNVGFPTIRGKARTAAALRALDRSPASFHMTPITIAGAGGVVLFERADLLRVGPLEIEFWVWGRFEVRDELITVWRDHFDLFDVTKGLGRAIGVLAARGLPRSLRRRHTGGHDVAAADPRP